MEWEAYLAGGEVVTSRDRPRWTDLPPRILVVRWWDGPRKGVHWGDSLYGDPSTWVAGVIVSDEEFARTMERARHNVLPPSRRGA
jgi:hypothetical protein